MPTYDYRCTGCDHRFEVTRPMGSTADECCPSCNESAKRVFTPFGVAFKGTGFHNTDYKSGGSAQTSEPACTSSGESSSCATCPAAAPSE